MKQPSPARAGGGPKAMVGTICAQILGPELDEDHRRAAGSAIAMVEAPYDEAKRHHDRLSGRRGER